MTWQPPPRRESPGLDFSRFHGLDHRPFSAYCRRQPGGGRRHLLLAWVIGRHGRDFWLRPWWRLRCFLTGQHEDMIWMAVRKAGASCKGCNRVRTLSEAELECLPRLDQLDQVINHIPLKEDT